MYQTVNGVGNEANQLPTAVVKLPASAIVKGSRSTYNKDKDFPIRWKNVAS